MFKKKTYYIYVCLNLSRYSVQAVCVYSSSGPAKTGWWLNVAVTLAHCLRRWANVTETLSTSCFLARSLSAMGTFSAAVEDSFYGGGGYVTRTAVSDSAMADAPWLAVCLQACRIAISNLEPAKPDQQINSKPD